MRLPFHKEKSKPTYSKYGWFLIIVYSLISLVFLCGAKNITQEILQQGVNMNKIYPAFVFIVIYLISNIYSGVVLLKYEKSQNRFFSTIALNLIIIFIFSAIVVIMGVIENQFYLITVLGVFYLFRIFYQFKIVKKYLLEHFDSLSNVK